jgi:glycosyltransferase involved in cell wall biosynthesis
MRLTYLSASGRLGGAEIALLEVIAGVRAARPSWPVQLVVAADGPLADRAATLGVEIAILPFPEALAKLGEHGAAKSRVGYVRFGAQLGLAAAPVAAYTRRLAQAVCAFGPDLIHSNGLKTHVLAAMAHLDAPLVWHVHDYISGRRVTAKLLRWNRARCAVVMANSRSVAEDVHKALGAGIPVVPVHNAVDLSRFAPEGICEDLDRLAGLMATPAGTLRVGLVATLARWKGHEVFLKAMAQLRREAIRGYVIGDALYQTQDSQYSLDELRRMAADLGLGECVGFTGLVDRADAAFRALDVVVHASTAPEPFGLVVAEAMACGRAVVVSDAGGVSELVTTGVDALTHAPGDIEGLAAAIRALAGDPARRAALGRAARSTAMRAFDRSRLASEVLTVYESATAVRA